MRTFEIAERRARLALRHRLAPGHRAPDVVSASDSLVCLHATDPATVYLSARARVDGRWNSRLICSPSGWAVCE